MSDEPSDASATPGPDIKERLRQLTQPLVDSLDARVKKQIDARVDETLDQRIDAAVAARLAVLERAIADLDRAVRDLQSRGLEL
ncbi:MAG: hypothetical protein ACRDV0_00215 [Acidimicrobiales bacterium]